LILFQFDTDADTDAGFEDERKRDGGGDDDDDDDDHCNGDDCNGDDCNDCNDDDDDEYEDASTVDAPILFAWFLVAGSKEARSVIFFRVAMLLLLILVSSFFDRTVSRSVMVINYTTSTVVRSSTASVHSTTRAVYRWS